MKRINLTKYGFVRWPEEDFNDDGSKFISFRAGKNVRVSKLISDGQAYLSIASDRCGNGTLPYEVYSKLPYYNEATWSYNGVSVDSLTEADIQTFYEACISYEKAYEDAEATIQYPTIEELVEQCRKIQAKTLSEVRELEGLMGNYGMEAAVKFSKYEWASLQECFKHMLERVDYFNPLTLPQAIYKKSISFTFVKENNNDLVSPTYWYRAAKEMFEKYKII